MKIYQDMIKDYNKINELTLSARPNVWVDAATHLRIKTNKSIDMT